MGFPTEFFTVLFAVARTAGWLSQWEEMLNDKEQKIARPRQIYVGYPERKYQSKLDYTAGASERKDAVRK
jgi:citrate synthase